LFALKPRFDEIWNKWYRRVESHRLDRQDLDAEILRRTGLTREQGSKLEGAERDAFEAVVHYVIVANRASRRLPAETDEEIKTWCSKLYEMIDEALSHSPVTREGLAMQCKAMLMDNYSDWRDPRTPSFVASVVLYLNMELPDFLMDDLFTAAVDEEDEA
jgi:hypothetical protein